MTENSATPLPDSGMATGNDEGQPGDRRDGGPLDDAERRLLAALEGDDGTSAQPAVEDGPAVAAAVADDAPLPAEGGSPDDGLDPGFTDR